MSKRELGDGEPSPPPAKQPRTFIGVRNHRETVLASLLEELVVIKQVNACCFKVWFGGVFCGVEGSEVAANNKGNVMTNSILRKLRSGAAQEVSPPSPVRRFPIIGGPSIPWEVIEPHERQAQSNHDQTLRRLAERGGLSPAEAWFVLNDANWEAGTDWKKADEDGRALLNSINLRYERNRAEGDTREIAALPKDGRWNAALDKAARKVSRMEVIAGQPRATVEKAVVEIRKLKEITALREKP